MTRRIATLLLLCIGLLVTAPAAQAACPQTSLIELQDEVMCVLCGVPLVNAGGQQADDVRDFIRERADQCQSKEQIKDALVAEFGTEVLAVPQKSGFDLTAWLVPIVGLALVLVAIAFGAVRWRRNKTDDAPAAVAAADGAELEDDIGKYDL
jgi:cytochrome c-type biogenesis protein CcmH/NrfF